MPYDITMCGGGDCPIKRLCYRHNAEIEGRQDFFGSIPFDFSTNTCQSFWKDIQVDEQIRLRAYQIWESHGRLHSDDTLSHWQQAENEFLGIIS
ncbi:MAG: DUF2934 domain-containing protein [Bacteroidota bacterium]|jgi:hypothetical protein